MTTSLGRVRPASVRDQAHGQIVEDRQGLRASLGLHPTAIFTEGHIAPVVRPDFNSPVRPIDFEPCLRIRLFHRVRSNSGDCLTASEPRMAEDRLAVDLETLPRRGPVEIVIETRAGRPSAWFDPPMPFLERAVTTEILARGEGRQARSGKVWFKLLAQGRVMIFAGPAIVAAGFDYLP